MKTFQVMRKSFAIMGIGEKQSQQKYLINVRNMITLFMLSGAATLNCFHLYYEAKTFNDYAIGIYTGLSLIVAAILFAVIINDMRQVVKCLINIEILVNESKFEMSKKIINSVIFQIYK